MDPAQLATLEEAIGKTIHGYACGCEKPWPVSMNYRELASAVIVAIDPVVAERDRLREAANVVLEFLALGEDVPDRHYETLRALVEAGDPS